MCFSVCYSSASAQSQFERYSGLASATGRMTLISDLDILMKSCRFLMWKSQNQSSKESEYRMWIESMNSLKSSVTQKGCR